MTLHDARLSREMIAYMEQVREQVHGARWVDIRVRRNGQWEEYEADWVEKLPRFVHVLKLAEEPRWYRALWRFRYITWPHMKDALRFLRPRKKAPAMACDEQSAPERVSEDRP